MGATTDSSNLPYQVVTNETGRVFRVGETPRDILGYGRWVPIMAAWLAMCLAGLLEYTWGTVSGSLQAAHHWSLAQTFWAFSFFVVFESFVQIGAGYLRNRGYLPVRWATIIGGIVCGIVGYGLLAYSTTIWQAYLGYAALGGIGSGMVYSSCINIVAKWYPERKGFLTGFVNGGWAYGAVPFIIVIGGLSGAALNMTPSQIKNYILWQGIIMTVGICLAGIFMKDPPKNWWPKETAALVADYYGETNNAINYGSIYAFKALGGSFAGGVAALIMTGTLYGTSHFHWAFGFFFGAAIGALAALTVAFLVKRPTREQMDAAVRKSADAQKPRPAMA